MSSHDGRREVTVFTILTRDAIEASVIEDLLWMRGVHAIEESAVSAGPLVLRSSFGVDETSTRSILETLLADFPGSSFDIELLDPRVADSWKEHALPVWVNTDLVVVPAWLTDSMGEEHLCVRIDPEGTFGLGDHPTTRGSLQMLSSVCEKRTSGTSTTILDVGCGSGILGITGLLLGAEAAHGVDIDPAVPDVSTANARLNNVEARWSVTLDSMDSLEGSFDIITANILAPVLVELARDLRRLLHPEGTLIISGLLTSRCDHVLAALKPLSAVERIDIDGWATIALRN